jgi:PAS domain S-box-containing protein
MDPKEGGFRLMQSGPLSLIIVEDEAAHTEAIRRSLLLADPSTLIRTAFSLTEFRELAQQLPIPDIALVDFNLSDGRALDLLNTPLENQQFPILVMTSQGDEQSAVEALKSGAIDYVVKSPDSFAAFPRTVERALREWQLLKARKVWVEALRESELRFRTLVECAPIGIYLTDAAGDCTYINRKWSEMSGITSEQAMGKGWTHAIHPADRETIGEKWYRALASEGRWGFEYRILTPSQTVTWVFGSASPIRDETGAVKGYICSNVDITERKKAEEMRLDLERRFLHAQKLESLGILAGGIAHDFNNLLMAILGNLELVQDELPAQSSIRAGIAKAMHATHRAADLTRQMLAYSGNGRFMFSGLNLNSIVEENIHIFKAAIAKNVSLNIHLGHDLPPILADASQIQQIVMNLIMNASEAIGERNGQVNLITRIQTCDNDLLARSRLEDKPPPGRFICIEVTDNGIGMDGEIQHRLFDPFFTTKATGRGLGMSSVLGIVRAHKGAILLESEIGRGSTFQVFFPVAEFTAPPPPEPDIEKSPAPAPSPHSGLILIVDDEEMVRSVCEKMVRRFGFQTLTAIDGNDAVEVFRQQSGQIDGVLLDLTMPGMDGVATLKALREIQPDIRVLLASGYSEKDVMNRFVDGQGILGVIQKPYQMSSLQRELEKFSIGPSG